LQVKSGEAQVGPISEIPKEVNEFFVFDLVGEPAPGDDGRITRIDKKALGDFFSKHAFLLPSHLQRVNF
jgi:hypothetical protein